MIYEPKTMTRLQWKRQQNQPTGEWFSRLRHTTRQYCRFEEEERNMYEKMREIVSDTFSMQKQPRTEKPEKNEMCTRALCIDNWFDLLAARVGVHCWYTKFISSILIYLLFARSTLFAQSMQICAGIKLRQNDQTKIRIRWMKVW